MIVCNLYHCDNKTHNNRSGQIWVCQDTMSETRAKKFKFCHITRNSLTRTQAKKEKTRENKEQSKLTIETVNFYLLPHDSISWHNKKKRQKFKTECFTKNSGDESDLGRRPLFPLSTWIIVCELWLFVKPQLNRVLQLNLGQQGGVNNDEREHFKNILIFLGGGPILYLGLEPIDPRSNCYLFRPDQCIFKNVLVMNSSERAKKILTVTWDSESQTHSAFSTAFIS